MMMIVLFNSLVPLKRECASLDTRDGLQRMLLFPTFLELPDDVLFSVFKWLEWKDIIHLDIAITSKRFRENWKRQLERYRGGNYSCVAQNKEGLNIFSILFLPSGKIATGQLSSQSHTIGIRDAETLC
jgi:hypothetical protein